MVCPKCRYQNPSGSVYCAKCGRKLDGDKKRRRIIPAIIIVLAVCVIIAALGYGLVKSTVSDKKIGTQAVEENAWVENVLMSDEVPEWIVYNGYDAFVMGSDIPRKQIRSITFLDTLKDAPTNSWDVSENGDGSVCAWVKNGSELFFGANGGINAKNCKSLFYGYYNVSEINFNHCFHTDFATNMASMFDFCPALSVLDVSDFNTANVTDMTGMFYDCSSLRSIDLSGFNTGRVTGMSCMFTNCSSMQSLDLSSFDTSIVTNMSGMFNKCLTLSNLNIDGFHTANVTDMGDMFFECPKLVTIHGIENFDIKNVVNRTDFMEPGKLVNGHRWEELFAGSNGNVETAKRPIAVDGGEKHSVILYSDGTVTTIGDDTYGQRSTSGWRDIVQISTFSNHTLGLKLDGTVVAAGANKEGQCDVSGWTDIIAVAAGSRHSVGVKRDGTVVAVGSNSSGQCDVGTWRNVKYVAANSTSTFGLTNDGKVLVCGSFYNQNLMNWSDIISISVSANHVVGVHFDGTVSAVGANDHGQRDGLEKKRDIVQVAVGYGFTTGLKSNGKVWVNGCDEHNEHAAMQWTDIVAIGTGTEHILGIKKDGTLVAKGTNDCGQCNMYPLNQEIIKSLNEDSSAEPAREVQFHYFEFSEDLDGQYAEIVGLDADNHTQWVYTSGVYDPGTQAPAISEIAYAGERYYFCEDGAIVVLDAATGNVLWRNWDFGGGCPSSYIDEDGTVYSCGYLGPDFFVVDAEGKTICRIERFDEEYCWPKKIEKVGNKIAVTMDIGPDYQAQKDYIFSVDLTDFSYELQGSVAES